MQPSGGHAAPAPAGSVDLLDFMACAQVHVQPVHSAVAAPPPPSPPPRAPPAVVSSVPDLLGMADEPAPPVAPTEPAASVEPVVPAAPMATVAPVPPAVAAVAEAPISQSAAPDLLDLLGCATEPACPKPETAVVQPVAPVAVHAVQMTDLLGGMDCKPVAAAMPAASPAAPPSSTAAAPAPPLPPPPPAAAPAGSTEAPAALDWLQVAAAKGLLFDELAQSPPTSCAPSQQGQDGGMGSLLDF